MGESFDNPAKFTVDETAALALIAKRLNKANIVAFLRGAFIADHTPMLLAVVDGWITELLAAGTLPPEFLGPLANLQAAIAQVPTK